MVRHGPDGSDLQTANSPEAAEIKKKHMKETLCKNWFVLTVLDHNWIILHFHKKGQKYIGYMCIDFNSQANNFANIRGHKPAHITILLVQQSDGQLGIWLAAFYFTKFSLTTL